MGKTNPEIFEMQAASAKNQQYTHRIVQCAAINRMSQEWDPATGTMVTTTVEIETGDAPQAQLARGSCGILWVFIAGMRQCHKILHILNHA